jgi:hypothetical protein
VVGGAPPMPEISVGIIMLGWKHANKTYGFEQLDCLWAMVPFGKLTSLPWKISTF